MSAIEMQPIGPTNMAEAIVTFAKPEKKYFPMTRLLATGSVQGDLDFSQRSTMGKVAAYALTVIGAVLDLIGSVLSIAYALHTKFYNDEIRAFNALPSIEQGTKNLMEQLDRCRDAANAYKKSPNDHENNSKLRAEIRKTTELLQLNQFVFPNAADDFEQIVRNRIESDFTGVMVTLTPHQKDDAHKFDYPLADLLLNGFYPVDQNGAGNPKLQGVDPATIAFRFEDGIFAPSKEGITNIFHAQSGIDLYEALGNLKRNLENIQRPKKEDADRLRQEIRSQIREKLKDRSSPEYRMLAEGAAQTIVRKNAGSNLAAVRNALAGTDLVALCDKLAQEELLPKERQGAFQSAVQRFGEVSELSTQVLNGAKAITYLGAAALASTQLPIVGPVISAAAGAALTGGKGALLQGAAAVASYLPEGSVIAGGILKAAYAIGGDTAVGGVQYVGRGLNTVMQAGGSAGHWLGSLFGSAKEAVVTATGSAATAASATMAGVASKLPGSVRQGLSSAAKTVGPYVVPAAATVAAGYALYKAYKYATAPALTTAQQTHKALTNAANLRNNAADVVKASQKSAALSLPAEEGRQKKEAIQAAIRETDEAFSRAEAKAKAALADPNNMDKLNAAHAAAIVAEKKAQAVHKAAAKFEQEVEKSYIDLDGLFKRAYKILNAVDGDLSTLDGNMTENDKRNALQKKLNDALRLLAQFEKTELPKVQEELREVASLQQQIEAVLRAQQADPSKNYSEQLTALRGATAQRKARSEQLMQKYHSIKTEIERLRNALGKINAPKKGIRLFG